MHCFPDPPRLPPPLISLERVSVGYVPGRPVLSRLDLRLDPDDRIALLGANGNGKSTFARLLAGRLERSEQHDAPTPQNCAAAISPSTRSKKCARPNRPTTIFRRCCPPLCPRLSAPGLVVSALAKTRPLFRSLSSRAASARELNLALVTHAAPALLVLDEPTNHLDLEIREALVEAINGFPGAVVLVSHDWHLLELVADQLWLVADGTVRRFDGDLDDYRRLLLERAEPVGQRRPALLDERRDTRRRAAEKRRMIAPLRQQARAAEAMVAQLVGERDRLDRGLAGGGEAHRNGAAIGDVLKHRARNSPPDCRGGKEEWLRVEIDRARNQGLSSIGARVGRAADGRITVPALELL